MNIIPERLSGYSGIAFLALAVIGVCLLILAYRWWQGRKHLTIDNIRRVSSDTCAFCKSPVTEENDCGWMVFVAPGMVQRMCKDCEKNIYDQMKKAAEDE